ncbi:MAG: FecR family protein, partial [Pedobacter sp.]
AYFDIFELEADYFNELSPAQQDEMSARLKNNIDAELAHQEQDGPGFFRSGRTWLGIAASLVLISLAGIYYNRGKNEVKSDPIAETKSVGDIAPGGNKATLTLADGSTISLTDAANGDVASNGGIKITKTKDGEVVYQVIADSAAALVNSLNTLKTPRGGQYRINLPDGTKVLLNAASSLTFPISFAGQAERFVELSGEAYFEVAHNSQQPFVVSSANQKIQVLGTVFNINAYADEPATVTTLLEGSVKVFHGSEAKVIKPREATYVTSTIVTKRADEHDIAWKEGVISFNKANLETIMRQVSRWYDVEVSYAGKTPTRLFTGEISRSANLSELIAILESSNIKFKFNKRHITIIP